MATGCSCAVSVATLPSGIGSIVLLLSSQSCVMYGLSVILGCTFAVWELLHRRFMDESSMKRAARVDRMTMPRIAMISRETNIHVKPSTESVQVDPISWRTIGSMLPEQSLRSVAERAWSCKESRVLASRRRVLFKGWTSVPQNSFSSLMPYASKVATMVVTVSDIPPT
jgi:hypothetical protein